MCGLSTLKGQSSDVLAVRRFLLVVLLFVFALYQELALHKIFCTSSNTQFLCNGATVRQRCFYDKIECTLLLLRDHHIQREIKT